MGHRLAKTLREKSHVKRKKKMLPFRNFQFSSQPCGGKIIIIIMEIIFGCY